MQATKLNIAVGIATAGRREVLAEMASFLARQQRLPDLLVICPVGPNDVIVKYTYSGDANLDGLVDGDDFNKFLAGFNYFNAHPTEVLSPAERGRNTGATNESH